VFRGDAARTLGGFHHFGAIYSHFVAKIVIFCRRVATFCCIDQKWSRNSVQAVKTSKKWDFIVK
jgi:hypothetical protein